MRFPASKMSKVVCFVCLALALRSFASAAIENKQVQNAASSHANSNFATLSAQADAARDADRIEEAEPLYKKALALRPNWAEGWWSLGTIAYDGNAYSEATHAFQKVTTLAPKNGNAYVMLGLSEFELGRDLPALQHLKKGAALGLSEDANLRHVALYHEGVLLQRAGKFQAAQETLEQLCLQGVQSPQAITSLGMVLLRMRDRETPTAGSDDAAIVSRIGEAGCLAAQKKFDESKKELSEVVSQHPEYPKIHYAFGIALMEANDLDGADAEFKQEIKNNPTDLVSRLQIVASMYKTNSVEGLPYAEEAVKLAPQQPFAHYLLGLLLLDTDDYQRAIPELEIARKAFPNESRIYLALGTAYSRAGRKQEAARARATFTRLTAEKKSVPGTEQESQPLGSEQIRVDDIPTAPN
jgi:tetratricopeptide (TPR) repeat protein